MIDLSDEESIANAISELQEGIGQMLLLEIRDTVGFSPDEVEITVSYLKQDKETQRHLSIRMVTQKDAFEEKYLEFAKRRLMNDARQLIGLPSDDPESYPLSDDDPGETPDEATS